MTDPLQRFAPDYSNAWIYYPPGSLADNPTKRHWEGYYIRFEDGQAAWHQDTCPARGPVYVYNKEHIDSDGNWRMRAMAVTVFPVAYMLLGLAVYLAYHVIIVTNFPSPDGDGARRLALAFGLVCYVVGFVVCPWVRRIDPVPPRLGGHLSVFGGRDS